MKRKIKREKLKPKLINECRSIDLIDVDKVSK